MNLTFDSQDGKGLQTENINGPTFSIDLLCCRKTTKTRSCFVSPPLEFQVWEKVAENTYLEFQISFDQKLWNSS